jgi:hypothetical protein
MSQEYFSVLARAIAGVGQIRAQLRTLMFELARSELRRGPHQRSLSFENDATWSALKQQISTLDKVVAQIESELIDDTMRLTISPQSVVVSQMIEDGTNARRLIDRSSSELVVRDGFDGEIIPPLLQTAPRQTIYAMPLPPLSEGRNEASSSKEATRSIKVAFRSIAQLTTAVLLGVAIFFFLAKRTGLFDFVGTRGDKLAAAAATVADVTPVQSTATASAKPKELGDLPVPDSYGVYAIEGGKLVALQALPIRVPDQRVGISALITSPSESVLPDGRLRFLVYRRDLLNNTPDLVTVRVVARVMRALTFDSGGKPHTVKVDGSWAVRSNVYEMRVSPNSGNPEMIVISPPDGNFTFPAGRYALVLNKNLAYDFSVDGQIIDKAQCLERTDAVNMPVYAECRNP